MNKDELRKIYLTKRLALTESEHRALSQKISDQFFKSVDLSRVRLLHIYLPIESKREPNTWLIIDRMQKDFPHIQLVIPRVNGDGMENILFQENDQLQKAKWGMIEPKNGKQADPQHMDIVIVPLLAVDMQGHRIGYGKGYYDRFLKLCRPDCKKIGISFFMPETHIEEKSSNDILLNGCIIPTHYVRF